MASDTAHERGRLVGEGSFSDDALNVVGALRAGSEAAFRTLVVELNPGLTRLARTYVTPAIAEEVVQDTWAAVIGGIDRFEGRSSLKTWIYRILVNKVRTLAPREARIIPFASFGSRGDHRAVDPDRLSREGAPGRWSRPPSAWHLPSEDLQSKELLEKISDAISRLPSSQQEVVLLRDVQGWSSDEVCDALAISAVNQRVLLHRGRCAVRNTLEEYLADV